MRVQRVFGGFLLYQNNQQSSRFVNFIHIIYIRLSSVIMICTPRSSFVVVNRIILPSMHVTKQCTSPHQHSHDQIASWLSVFPYNSFLIVCIKYLTYWMFAINLMVMDSHSTNIQQRFNSPNKWATYFITIRSMSGNNQ